MSGPRLEGLIALTGMLREIELAKLAQLRRQQEALSARMQKARAASLAVMPRPVDALDLRLAQAHRDWGAKNLQKLQAQQQALSQQVEEERRQAALRVGQNQALRALHDRQQAELLKARLRAQQG